MSNERAQIDAILRQNTLAWAKSQLAPGVSIDDHDYDDFITVSPDAVVDDVLQNGLRSDAVWQQGDPPAFKDDRLVIEQGASGWRVYYVERDDVSEERHFATYEEAVRDLVMRLMRSAWTSLNHRYWHAHHPELTRLPDFGQPWPVTGTPA